MTAHRSEKDLMDAIDVPVDKFQGAQIQRSLEHFHILSEKIPRELVYALALAKRVVAKINQDPGLLTAEKAGATAATAGEVFVGKHAQEFPLVIWQTGSGTQNNMNMNGALANHVSKLLGDERGTVRKIHPNDDVNKDQSPDDVFPTATHIAAPIALWEKMIPPPQALWVTLSEKAAAFRDTVKTGRTHLQDATPSMLGQEISGWMAMSGHSLKHVGTSQPHFAESVLGGTVVGTGLDTHPKYAVRVAAELASLSGWPLVTTLNKFEALATVGALVYVHGALKDLTASLTKIANGVCWLAPGPRCGTSETVTPENESGSPIIPGKASPTQCGVLIMVCCQVMGSDVAVNIGGVSSNFELNVYRPMVIHNSLQPVRLLVDGMASSNEHCAVGIESNRERISQLLNESLMLVTALNTHIGYDKMAGTAKKVHHGRLILKAPMLVLGYLTEVEFDSQVRPKKMVGSLATHQPAGGAGAGQIISTTASPVCSGTGHYQRRSSAIRRYPGR